MEETENPIIIGENKIEQTKKDLIEAKVEKGKDLIKGLLMRPLEDLIENYRLPTQSSKADILSKELTQKIIPTSHDKYDALKGRFEKFLNIIYKIPDRKLALESKEIRHLAAKMEKWEILNGGIGTGLKCEANLLISYLADDLHNTVKLNPTQKKEIETELKEFLEREVLDKKTTHDAKVLLGLNKLALDKINDKKELATTVNAEFQTVTEHELSKDFLDYLQLNYNNVKDCAKTVGELLFLTDAENEKTLTKKGEEIKLADFNAEDFFYLKESYKEHFNRTMKGVYSRFIDGLDETFEKQDTAEKIAEKAEITLKAAKYIHDLYQKLKNDNKIDLFGPYIEIPGKPTESVYKPTAARVLLRKYDNDETYKHVEEFFKKFCTSKKLRDGEEDKLREKYEKLLIKTAGNQVVQYMENSKDYRDLQLNDGIGDKDIKDCIANPVLDPLNNNAEKRYKKAKDISDISAIFDL